MQARLPMWGSGPCAELDAGVAEEGLWLRQGQ
jgi:hypothetical protein